MEKKSRAAEEMGKLRDVAEARLANVESMCATLIHTGRALGAKEVEGALAHMPSKLRARVEAKLKGMETAPVQTSAPTAVTWRWAARACWSWLTGRWKR